MNTPPPPCAVNTKAEVRFHVSSADWLPERVRERVLSMVGVRYIPDCVCVCLVQVEGDKRGRVGGSVSGSQEPTEEPGDSS